MQMCLVGFILFVVLGHWGSELAHRPRGPARYRRATRHEAPNLASRQHGPLPRADGVVGDLAWSYGRDACECRLDLCSAPGPLPLYTCAPPGLGFPPFPPIENGGAPSYTLMIFTRDHQLDHQAKFLRPDLYQGQPCLGDDPWTLSARYNTTSASSRSEGDVSPKKASAAK